MLYLVQISVIFHYLWGDYKYFITIYCCIDYLLLVFYLIHTIEMSLMLLIFFMKLCFGKTLWWLNMLKMWIEKDHVQSITFIVLFILLKNIYLVKDGETMHSLFKLQWLYTGKTRITFHGYDNLTSFKFSSEDY